MRRRWVRVRRMRGCVWLYRIWKCCLKDLGTRNHSPIILREEGLYTTWKCSLSSLSSSTMRSYRLLLLLTLCRPPSTPSFKQSSPPQTVLSSTLNWTRKENSLRRRKRRKLTLFPLSLMISLMLSLLSLLSLIYNNGRLINNISFAFLFQLPFKWINMEFKLRLKGRKMNLYLPLCYSKKLVNVIVFIFIFRLFVYPF